MKVGILKRLQGEIGDIVSRDAYLSKRAFDERIERVTSATPSFLSIVPQLFVQPGVLSQYLLLRRSIRRAESMRLEHNDEFIEREIDRQEMYFDTVLTHPLDYQQRRAVVADEDNNLVVAGAGSGKTSTITAKIKYFVDKQGVLPQHILPISFTHKSAEEMKRRINIPGVSPMTFHKFGLDVVQSVEKKPVQVFEDSRRRRVLGDIIRRLLTDEAYLDEMNQFLMYYGRVYRSQFSFESKEAYTQYMKEQNFTTYNGIKMKQAFKDSATYNNEEVKSIEECLIANFLAINRVKYTYEQQYDYPLTSLFGAPRYLPDFTIHTAKGPVYLEHFGCDRNGNVPAFFAQHGETRVDASRRYQQQRRWKQKIHKENGTQLIESFSYEYFEGSLFVLLAKKLRKAGVKLDPMSPREVWEFIQGSGREQSEGFVKVVDTFVTLLKSNNETLDSVLERVNAGSRMPLTERERSRRFINLIKPILAEYANFLNKENVIDFSDMINRAAEYIRSGAYPISRKYVVVDEFQDLSLGRYRLLESIREQQPSVKFYCVGDDWQSIYRFAGSDITFLVDFAKHFGATYTTKIETTYRFSDPLMSMSSHFILKNPHQLKKTLIQANAEGETYYTVLRSRASARRGDDTETLINGLKLLLSRGMTPGQSIFVVGRYGFDLKRITTIPGCIQVNEKEGSITYWIEKGEFTGQTLTLHFLTAHKAKGLEADYVFIINCNSGLYGFPTAKSDDPLLGLLLGDADHYEYGEERRLFYVAMTRARRHTIFITSNNQPSRFIKELERPEPRRVSDRYCLRCLSGQIVKAPASRYVTYICTNRKFGCEYVSRVMPPY